MILVWLVPDFKNIWLVFVYLGYLLDIIATKKLRKNKRVLFSNKCWSKVKFIKCQTNSNNFDLSKSEDISSSYGLSQSTLAILGWQDQLSKPQLNHNSTQPNITLIWVRHENDFAHHPPPHPPQKLKVSNTSGVTDLILMKL